MHKKTVAIIGGGAAGYFCAANIDRNLYHTLILEQGNDVLQKVKISGGGRCNVTHACFDPRELVQFYPRGNRELLSVFTKFQPGDTMEWFVKHDVPLKIEEDGRVFPESNSSKSIITALRNAAEEKNTELHTKTPVKNIILKDNTYLIEAGNISLEADFIVFTTGSSPKSFQLLALLGHSIVPPVPSLFTFNINDSLLEGLSGTSFPNAEINIPGLKAQESGALLITHWGLSGPAVLKISAWEARTLAALEYQFDIRINFIGKTIYEAEALFMEYRGNHSKKTITQSRIFDVTGRFWNRVLELAKILPDKSISNISSKELKSLLRILCEKDFHVNGKSTFKDEFVTAGGVELKEINFKNMASRKLPNFYIAGEVLNIDAVTGGFNFQACWSEAFLIAQDLNTKTF